MMIGEEVACAKQSKSIRVISEGRVECKLKARQEGRIVDSENRRLECDVSARRRRRTYLEQKMILEDSLHGFE